MSLVHFFCIMEFVIQALLNWVIGFLHYFYKKRSYSVALLKNNAMPEESAESFAICVTVTLMFIMATNRHREAFVTFTIIQNHLLNIFRLFKIFPKPHRKLLELMYVLNVETIAGVIFDTMNRIVFHQHQFCLDRL